MDLKPFSTPPQLCDDLVNKILLGLYSDCDGEVRRSASLVRKKEQCFHAKNLLHCLTVSKQWHRLAARHLWSRYAQYVDLARLLNVPTLLRPQIVSTFMIQKDA